MKEELEKYETELGEVQKKLNELDSSYAEQRGKLVKHGSRIEGIVLFLRDKLASERKADEDVKEPEVVEPAAEAK